MRDPRPAQIQLSVALLPVPALVQPRFFRVNFRAYGDLRTTSTIRECDHNTMPEGLDSNAASGRSSSVSGRSGTGPGPDIEVGQLEEAGELVGSMWRTRS